MKYEIVIPAPEPESRGRGGSGWDSWISACAVMTKWLFSRVFSYDEGGGMYMDKSNMSINPRLCTGCACCQLSCSYAYTGAFNPAKARIVPEASASIVFTDECIPNCSLCARYCAQGAIKHLEKVRV